MVTHTNYILTTFSLDLTGKHQRREDLRFGYAISIIQMFTHPPNEGLDKNLKQMAQTYYEENYGSRDDFRKEFRKSYL